MWDMQIETTLLNVAPLYNFHASNFHIQPYSRSGTKTWATDNDVRHCGWKQQQVANSSHFEAIPIKSTQFYQKPFSLFWFSFYLLILDTANKIGLNRKVGPYTSFPKEKLERVFH